MMTIDDLAEGVLSGGDREGLARLFAELRDPVYHFLLRLTGDAGEAEDAAQETFRRALASLPGLRDPRAFRGWIYRIARRVAWDAREARRKAAAALPNLPVPQETTTMNTPDFERVNRAVEDLDEDLRVTVRLRYEQDLGYDEIAAAMECPSGTVAKRLHTAHERLRIALAGAGFVIAVAAIGELLARAPRTPAPAALAEALARMVSGHPLKTGPAGLSLVVKSLFVAAPLLLVLVTVAVVAGRSEFSGDEQERIAEAPKTTSSAATSRTPTRSAAASPKPSPSVVLQKFSGSVVDRAGGAAIAGARLVLTPWAQGPAGEAIEVAADGRGEFTASLAPGEYALDVRAPGYVAYALERRVESVWLNNVGGDGEASEALERECYVAASGPVSRKIHLVKATGIRGRVLDHRGVPLAGARFEGGSYHDTSSQCGFPGPTDLSNGGLTDHDGRFEIGGIYPRGVVKVGVTALGYEAGGAQVEVGPEPSVIEIRMKPGRDLSITLTGPRGEALTGVSIAAGGAAGLAVVKGDTGRDGRVNLRDLPADTRYVAAYRPGGEPRLIDLVGLPSANVHVVLPEATGSAWGRVLDADGTPVAGVVVGVHHYTWASQGRTARITFKWTGLIGWDCPMSNVAPDSVVGISLPEATRPPEARTDAEGRFRIDGVAFVEGMDVCIIAGDPAVGRITTAGRPGDLGDLKLERFGK